MTDENDKLIALGRAVIATECDALQALHARINGDFAHACRLILDCTARVVVTGMGKSGHIANKIAATLASTGTPAFFVHAGEASHGDLGMITPTDVVLALSNSGETDEITILLPVIKRLDVALIALTGRPVSTLAKAATVHIDVGVREEACPLGLAPTASTTAALAMGDALAIALLEARGFSVDDFAIAHPGGALGRRLLLRVDTIMHTGATLPLVFVETRLADALVTITKCGLGVATVVDGGGRLLGIFTDGDLRRALDNGADIRAAAMGEIMTADCKTIKRDCLAERALAIMDESRINALPVVDDANILIGLINMHDLLKAKVI